MNPEAYHATIVEHHRAPQNTGRVSEPSHAASGHNPLCGDRVEVTLRVSGTTVSELRCEAKGCAICRASGSLMTVVASGLELAAVVALAARVLEALARTEPPGAAGSEGEAAEAAELAEFGPLAAVVYARHFPGRSGCAGLPWQVLGRALGPAPA